MKLQKLTEKRWFWPLVCAVSVVFGWWYLSIVTLSLIHISEPTRH